MRSLVFKILRNYNVNAIQIYEFIRVYEKSEL